MRYNPDITNQYGDNIDTRTYPPVPSKPLPSSYDYKFGSFTRLFAKKVNENVLVEIKGEDLEKINTSLYKIVSVNWKISGPRDNVYSGNFIDGTGVIQQNNFEIERVLKEQGVDLKAALPNPLEYWQGH